LCQRHYMQWWLGDKSIPAPLERIAKGTYETCTVDDCDKPHKAKGYCLNHYKRVRAGLPLEATPRQGEQVPTSTLTDDAVRKIRRLYEAGESLAALGRKFSISDSTVSKIVKRQRWAHVD
jgi:hypothetical protein